VETGEGGGASGCVVDPNMKAQENRIVPPQMPLDSIAASRQFSEVGIKKNKQTQNRTETLCTQ
jgi:hypothetical protein